MKFCGRTSCKLIMVARVQRLSRRYLAWSWPLTLSLSSSLDFNKLGFRKFWKCGRGNELHWSWIIKHNIKTRSDIYQPMFWQNTWKENKPGTPQNVHLSWREIHGILEEEYMEYLKGNTWKENLPQTPQNVNLSWRGTFQLKNTPDDIQQCLFNLSERLKVFLKHVICGYWCGYTIHDVLNSNTVNWKFS